MRISIAGKKFALDPLKPVITRAMLPQDFISLSEPVVTWIPLTDENIKRILNVMQHFKVTENVPATVEYNGQEKQYSIATSEFMTAEELWNCYWFYQWKNDVPRAKFYLRLAVDKDYPPAYDQIAYLLRPKD